MKKTIAIRFFYTTILLWLLAACNNSEKQIQNRLSKASSPYLQEHADNPVDWYEWGDEAIAKAKAENKPLLISIGYASCHWCHVMEKESFMDTAVARIMNENFINIKVDREERPDIDNIYTNACQLLTGGNSGWPLNAFALPDGKPFFAGTYYTKESWLNLLGQISKAYKEQNKKVQLQASSLTYGIINMDVSLVKADSQTTVITQKSYRNYFDSIYKKVDPVNGGLKGSPKFPTPSLWEFMLQYHYLTGDKVALNTVTNTLEKMALGGIYDQAGGGFARYATDSLWRIPHFEKMLYDNAQLISLYAHAYQVTKNDFFKNIVFETTAFIDRELTAPGGGFYSSLNADTESGEGEFYAWEFNEIKKAFDDQQAGLLMSYYNIRQTGNWEKNKNLLYASYSPGTFAIANKISMNDFNNLLINTKKALLAERNKRIKPSVDDKVLTSWNALMLKAYADAYTAIGDTSFLKRALSNAVFIEKNILGSDGHLWRNFRNGKASVDGFLDDYALLAKAYIKLYQVSFDKHWLSLAQKITDYAISNFYDGQTGMFYYTSTASGKLAVRKIEILDNVIPSSNAVMGEVLFSLNIYFENNSYLQKSSEMLSKTAGKLESLTSYYSQWCYLAGLFAFGTYEVAIMGRDARQKNEEIQKNYLPKCVFLGGTDEENLPLLENKLAGSRTLIYVCTNKTCKLPVEDVAKALQQIK
ncbi:MAG: thioredoxin domain-containing protein [Chitinophagaceae bacterium]